MPFRPLTAMVNDGNFGQVLAGTLTTTNSTATAIITYSVPANSAVYFEIKIVGTRTDDGSRDLSVNTLTCAYKNAAGTVTQVGTDTTSRVYSSTSLNSTAASSSVSGTTVSIKIAGVNATTVNWVLQSSLAIVSL